MSLENRFPLQAPYFQPDRWVSALNFHPEAYPEHLEGKSIYLYDVTLRDGEQLPGVAFSEDERVRIGVALAELGVARIETGMPIISKSIFSATKKLAALGLGAQFVPQCRAEMDDVALTAETGSGAIVIVHTINPYHAQHVFELSPEALIERIVSACRYAKEQGLHTSFMASDVFRCELDFIREVYRTVAKEAKPDVMVVTDTVGCATPWAVQFVMQEVAKLTDIPLEFHGHNDFGMGTATAIGAVMGGAAGIQSSFNGLGERTGNAPTEEVVAALEIAMNIRTGIKLEQILAVSELIQDISQVKAGKNKAIVGEDIFATESHIVGLIQHKMHEAMGIDTGMYAFPPSLFGHRQVRYLLGKGSGPTAIALSCERLGLEVSEVESRELLELVKAESRLRKATLSDVSFRQLVQRVKQGA